MLLLIYVFLFFFSSRRRHTRCALVTGVQTCALPIYQTNWALPKPSRQSVHNLITPSDEVAKRQAGLFGLSDHLKRLSAYGDSLEELGRIIRSEERRVGKEGGSTC